MTLGVRYKFLAFGLTRLATLFLACRNYSLAIFFPRAFPTLVIACVDLNLCVVCSAAVLATFTRATTTTTAAPNVASTGMNTGNFLGKLVLWNLGYSGCEVIICL